VRAVAIGQYIAYFIAILSLNTVVVKIQAFKEKTHMENITTETITLGGGCFWCTEAIVKPLRGVTQVVSGYANGHVPNPSYEQVCAGTTGHAEVVRVWFNPQEIAVHELLMVFFVTHDPTTLNRQGNDIGTQYRSGVYWETEAQQSAALAVVAELSRQELWPEPIVTEIEPLAAFFAAEPYHQDYFARHPLQGYCRAIIAPKVAKFRKHYGHLLANA
jgi:peptide-methionine (S)-S-oxide reductase